MAFAILQTCHNRYLLPHGKIMQHQISLGIINVVYVLPLYVAIAHNLVAALLLLTIFTVNYLAWKK